MRLVRVGAIAAALRITLVIALAAVLVSGCHVPGTGGSGAAGSGGGSITVAAVPGFDNAPLRIAVDDGLFKDHGLNVTLKTFSSLAPEMQALTSGRADIAVGDYSAFFYEQATGAASLRLIGDAYDAVPGSAAVLTLPTSGITTTQQLVNQTVAAPRPR